MTTENEVTAQTCAVCITDIDADDVVMTVNDDVVCNDCLRVCERCSDVYSQDDDMSIVNGNDIWCADCVSQRAYYCDHCEEYNSYGSTRLQDRREDWCEDCLSNTYWCEDCDGYYVDGCDESHYEEPDSRIVHDYNYRPDPIFHGEKGERLFFGIEIEVEAGNNLNDASNYAYRLEDLDLAYLKSDGSLNCGFEVVSHPISHNHWKNMVPDFFNIMEGLRSDDDYKVKSWDTKTCGIHIHVSRAGFGEANGYGAGPHMHRFLNLIYSNQELYEALAGRSSSRWASFHDIDREVWDYDADGNRRGTKNSRRIRNKITHGYGSERYSAVNTKNAHTLEMRIFRGSVNSNVIKAHLDLAHASVEYTRVMSVSQVRDGALSPDNFIAYIKDNATLYPELVARLAKVWTSPPVMSFTI